MERWRISKDPRTRHTALALALLATVFLYFGWPARQPRLDFTTVEGHLPTLAHRLMRAEQIWQRDVVAREALIKKFGPKPENVIPFPVDPPWPPYTLWDFFVPSYNCPWEVERLGTAGDGGKWVCGFSRIEAKQKPCIVYSFGINHESSFEAEILERAPHCQVWGFDFSVTEFGPEITSRPELLERAHFSPYGLAGTDAHGSNDNPPMYTLSTLLRMNGHSFVDILKIDIEGWEFETLRELVKYYKGSPLPFGQLQIEIHVWDKSFPEMLTFWQSLEDAGLRAFWTEPNLVYINYNRGKSFDLSEYSFLNVGGKHEVVSD